MRRQLLATETFHGKRLILPDPCYEHMVREIYCTEVVLKGRTKSLKCFKTYHQLLSTATFFSWGKNSISSPSGIFPPEKNPEEYFKDDYFGCS